MDLKGRIVNYQGGRPSEVRLVGAIAVDNSIVRIIYVGGGTIRWADVNSDGWILGEAGDPTEKVFRIEG